MQKIVVYLARPEHRQFRIDREHEARVRLAQRALDHSARAARAKMNPR